MSKATNTPRTLTGADLAFLVELLANTGEGYMALPDLAIALKFKGKNPRTFTDALARSGWKIGYTVKVAKGGERAGQARPVGEYTPAGRVLTDAEIQQISEAIKEDGRGINRLCGPLGFDNMHTLKRAMARSGVSVMRTLVKAPGRVRIPKAKKAGKQ